MNFRIIFVIFFFFGFSSCLNQDNNGSILHVEYFESGEKKLEIITNKNSFEKCGTYFRKDGTRKKHLCYLNEKLHGSYHEYFEDGNAILKSLNYVNGSLEGVAIEFYKNGSIKDSIQFENNLKDGDAVFYYENSKIKAINKFSRNQLLYKGLYNDQGEIFEESYYPLINLTADSIYLGDTLGVSFELTDLHKLSKSNLGRYEIIYDFQNKSFDTINYSYPKNKYSFLDISDEHLFILDDIGVQELYGNLQYIESNDTITFQKFGREVSVLPKRK